MFADDSVLIQSGADPNMTVKTLEKDLTKISDYFLSLNLNLNKKKTKIMNVDVEVRKNSNCTFPELILGNIGIEPVDNFDYIGVTIDTSNSV